MDDFDVLRAEAKCEEKTVHVELFSFVEDIDHEVSVKNHCLGQWFIEVMLNGRRHERSTDQLGCSFDPDSALEAEGAEGLPGGEFTCGFYRSTVPYHLTRLDEFSQPTISFAKILRAHKHL